MSATRQHQVECVGPTTCASLLQSPQPQDRARALVRGAALALDAFHARGRVHGAICARSYLVGEDLRVTLLPPDTADGAGVSDDPEAVRYWSPQRRAGEPARQTDDLYALGLLARELLAVSHDRAPEADPGADRRPSALPDDVEAVLRAQMAWSPSERLTSGAQLVRELDRAFAVGQGGGGAAAAPAHHHSTVASEPAWAAAKRVAQARRAYRLSQSTPPRPARPARPRQVRAPLGRGHYPDMPLPLGWVAAVVLVLCSVYLLPIYFMLFPAG